MFLRKKKRKGEQDKLKTINVDEVYVASANIKASVGEGKGFYDRKVTMFYLAVATTYGYKELFSGRDLIMDEDEEFLYIPFIQKVEPLREYLNDPEKVEITYQSLFDFIVELNAMVKFGSLETIKKGRKKQ